MGIIGDKGGNRLLRCQRRESQARSCVNLWT
jgi:hypothetical protein